MDNQRILEDNLKQLPTLAKANDRKTFAASIDEINDSLTALARKFYVDLESVWLFFLPNLLFRKIFAY